MRPTSFQAYIDAIYERFRHENRGEVATYIPELARVDPDWFGVALVTVHGHVYQAGDSRQPFSIQSISKAFVYGMALEDSGPVKVAEKIDVEPSGEAFNSISLEPDTGRPRNPMINAGAIVATSLVEGDDADSRMQRILNRFSAYAGRELEVDEAIYRSELETGHRNRAIAHLLRNYEILEGDPEQALEAYFRQCSTLVTARDLASMGACLANDGVNPITGIRALESRHVPRVLSVMATCGMYDYSGNWIFQVGMPAKSGVGGGVVAVLPGQFGLAVYSPRLDCKWNSVRGIAVCEALSRDYGMHMLRSTPSSTTGVIRSAYTSAEVSSKLSRDPESLARIEREGDRVQVMELTGELTFVTAEMVVGRATELMAGRDHLVLDLARVAAIDQSATLLLAEMTASFLDEGKRVFITGWQGHFRFYQSAKEHFKARPRAPEFEWQDIDRALEEAENGLLGQGTRRLSDADRVPMAGQLLCKGLEKDELKLLCCLLAEERFEPGETICREGEAARMVYFLCRGRVTVVLQLDRRKNRRLGAFVAGWVFGEAAFFPGRLRSADIVADTEVEVAVLDPARLRNTGDLQHESLLAKLMANLAEQNLERLAKANGEIRILSR